MEKEKKEENRRKRNRSGEYDDTDCEGSKTRRKESLSESAAPPISPPNHCFALFAVSVSALIASHLLSFFKPAKFPNFSFRLQIARVSIDFAAEGGFWFPDRPLPHFLPPARFSIFQIGQWQIAELTFIGGEELCQCSLLCLLMLLVRFLVADFKFIAYSTSQGIVPDQINVHLGFGSNSLFSDGRILVGTKCIGRSLKSPHDDVSRLTQSLILSPSHSLTVRWEICEILVFCGVVELHQVFLDMAVLVQAQGATDLEHVDCNPTQIAESGFMGASQKDLDAEDVLIFDLKPEVSHG
ncbi:hypothetical protein ACFX2J_024806 [Malus domestica]